ncbi:MAG: hypothetical protein ACRD5H_05870 [Nitrososphaerales archaeon]
MQTKKADNVVGARDLELENIVGNLLIAEYQVDRLRSRLIERCDGRVGSQKTSSAYTFKDKGKWYRVSLKIDQMNTDEDC